MLVGMIMESRGKIGALLGVGISLSLIISGALGAQGLAGGEWRYSYPRLKCDSPEERAFDKSQCRKSYYSQFYRQQCQLIAQYFVQDRYQVDCYHNYHHYNAFAYLKQYKRHQLLNGHDREIRIGGFNFFHPTNGKTLFKDLALVATIIDREFDLLAGLELIPVRNQQFIHNSRMDAYIKYYQEILETMSLTEIERFGIVQNIERAKFSYIAPGYIKILTELRKRDPHWALIMSAQPESAKPRDQKEFVGYYYRASAVKPVPNKYCSREVSLAFGKKYLGRPYGCIPWFNKKINRAFSRRPFIANFKSGNFRFTMVSSHVTFNSPLPSNIQAMADILTPAFGISDYKLFGSRKGMTKNNYARWAEVKLTLEMMQVMRKKYRAKNIIYVADFNLEKKAAVWDKVLSSFPGGKLYIEQATSLSMTGGYASNFDHFIFDPTQVTACVQANGRVAVGRVDFFTTGYITQRINREDYTDIIWENFMHEFDGKWQTRGIIQDSKNSWLYKAKAPPTLVPYQAKVDKYQKSFKKITQPQEKLDTIYNRYIKVLSDHVPIYLRCRIQ